jgi:hypothetical protein
VTAEGVALIQEELNSRKAEEAAAKTNTTKAGPPADE